ncbi:MAG: nucleotidyltransferase family protein [Bacilli bacterium]|nr:nucleotidyltransferase family protein [Bacilli bacterium]
MNVIGIICEYNPFHNGHLYHLKEIQKMYPDALIVLCLNGYFTQRGEVSVLTKEDKVKLALEFGVDLVVELPFIYGTQSSDYFASASLKILSNLGITHFVFGTETKDLEILKKSAYAQLESDFKILGDGTLNYPTRLAKALGDDVSSTPNDLLAISYLKEIKKQHYKIIPVNILRTSSYHDLTSNDEIISASNIREKLKRGKDVSPFIPFKDTSKFVVVNEDLEFLLLSYQILTNPHLEQYLDVVEGLENKLVKEVVQSHSIQELIYNIKSKRYTYNRIQRMLIHVLIGLPKNIEDMSYIRILGFNLKGKNYLHTQKKKSSLPFLIDKDSLQYQFELTASRIYDILTHQNTISFEKRNQVIYVSDTSFKESNQK